MLAKRKKTNSHNAANNTTTTKERTNSGCVSSTEIGDRRRSTGVKIGISSYVINIRVIKMPTIIGRVVLLYIRKSQTRL